MNNVAEIWNARNLKRGLHRHWVRLGDEMMISGEQHDACGALSICRPNANGRLFATLTLADRQLTEEVTRSGELVVQIRDIELIVSVRAIEGTRVLVEFGMPHGNRAKIALWG
jgi:hypothetical protein